MSVHQLLLRKREAMRPALIWLTYLKCRFLRTKSLITKGTENWAPSSEQDFCALNHTAASTRADSNTCSCLHTVVVPLPTFYLKRQENKPSQSVQKPALSLLWIYFYRKPVNLMGITWELLDSLNSALKRLFHYSSR